MHIPLQQKKISGQGREGSDTIEFIFTFEASKVRPLSALIEVTVLLDVQEIAQIPTTNHHIYNFDP